MTTGASLLENTLEKIARIIARRRGVTVRLRGGTAFVDLEKMEVVLPQVTDDQYKNMAPYIDGICDHETGHVLWTDPKVTKEATKGTKDAKGRIRHIFWNVLEDFRTEAKTREQYVGCGQNLARMNVYFTDWWVKENWNGADMLGRLVFAIGCKLRGDSVAVDFDADPKMGELLQMLAPEIEMAKKGMVSSAEALALADRMLAKIKGLAESAPQEQPKKGESDEKQDGDGDGAGTEGGGMDGDSESGKSDETEDSGEGEDSDDDSGESGEDGGDTEEVGGGDDMGDGQESKEGQGEKEVEGEGEQTDGGTDEDADAEGSEDEKASEVAQRQAKSFEQQSSKFNTPPDIEGFVNEHITKFSDDDDPSDPEHYVVFSEEWDTEKRYTVDERVRHARLYSEIKEQVREYIGTMATALESALATEAESCWVGGERRGRKLDRRRLAEWIMGSENDGIWKRLQEGESLDTAVTLLWDCSGSMGSSELPTNKAALARIAAIAFHEALVKAGIPHEVLGFNTDGPCPTGLSKAIKEAQERGDDLSRYSRLNETDGRYVFVDFGQTDGRAICNITGDASNRDGEAVMWAAKRLAQRPEKRKILIVGSDGQPAGAKYHRTEKRYLQECVRRVMSAGIEVVGIGIMDESVKKYYPANVVISEARDLPKVVIGQLTNLLLKRGTRHERRQALL